MHSVTLSIDWPGSEREETEAAENRARDVLRVYGFSTVTVRAMRKGDKVILELSGPDADVRKASDLFRG